MKKLLLIFLIAAPMATFGQTDVKDDTSSVDKVITAMYDVISGPAGQRDWDRFKNLFTADGKMGSIFKGDNEPEAYYSFTPDFYIKNNNPYFMEHPFYEVEIHRETHQFGSLVQVFSTYETTLESGNKTRGINSIELVRHKDRWWIASLIWMEELPGNDLPKEFLPD